MHNTIVTAILSARRFYAAGWQILLPLILAFTSCSCSRNSTSAPTGQSPPAKDSPETALVFCTYNVLADQVGVQKRLPALFAILQESQADIIALQEVAPWFLLALEQEEWARAYHPTIVDGKHVAPGGQYILSKLPVKSFVYRYLPGRQRRTVLVAEVEVNGRRIAVATTHMESYLEDGPIRAAQLDVIFPLLAGYDDAILLGDLNFGDGEPETAHLRSDYVDLWTVLHPAKPGFTWDIEKSRMARRGSFPKERSRRLDRILVSSAVWDPKWIRIVGDQAVTQDNELFPSDHFGLVGALEQRQR